MNRLGSCPPAGCCAIANSCAVTNRSPYDFTSILLMNFTPDFSECQAEIESQEVTIPPSMEYKNYKNPLDNLNIILSLLVMIPNIN